MLHLTLMILRMRSYTRVTPSHVKNAPEEVRIATPSIPLRWRLEGAIWPLDRTDVALDYALGEYVAMVMSNPFDVREHAPAVKSHLDW